MEDERDPSKPWRCRLIHVGLSKTFIHFDNDYATKEEAEARAAKFKDDETLRAEVYRLFPEPI